MTTADIIRPSAFLDVVARVFHCQDEAESLSRSASTFEDTARADLLECIENGYAAEDTGDRVELPRFARSYAKTVVECDGWA